MRYIAIDIETTGLDPEKHQILEFAAIFDDLKNPMPLGCSPFFIRRIEADNYVISDYCLKMHQKLLGEIRENVPAGNNISINDLGLCFRTWLTNLNLYETVYTVAGKNFAGFDGQFLKRVPNFPMWNYRVLDVGSLYATRDGVPSLDEITCQGIKHRAYSDALAVVEAVRGKLL